MTSLRSSGIALLIVGMSACTPAAESAPTTLTDTTSTTAAPRISTTNPTSSTTIEPPTVEGGIEWTRIDDPSFDGGQLASVVAAGPGLVAVGTDEVPEDAAVWLSSDGTEWRRIRSESFAGDDDSNGLEGRQFMSDAVAGPSGIVAVGGYERRAERDLDPGIWRSDDAEQWVRVQDPDFGATGPGHLNAVTLWNSLYVAVGEGPGPVGSGERRPAVWTSPDGVEWEAAESLALRIDGTIHDVVGRGPSLYAVGVTGHVLRPAVWFSNDGVTWDVVTSSDQGDSLFGSVDIGATERFQDLAMTTVAATPDGFVAAGWTGYPSRAAFWESSDGLFWSLIGVHPDAERGTIPVTANALVATPKATVAVGSARLHSTLVPPLSFAEVWLSDTARPRFAQLERASTSTVLRGPDSPWHLGSMLDVVPFEDRLIAVGFLSYESASLPGPFYRQAVWVGSWE